MKWFISDLHLSHDNVRKASDRPFVSVNEMNDAIINNILAAVKRGDHLYILGDVAYKRDVLIDFLHTMKGRGIFVHLIIGNHDLKLLNEEIKALVESVSMRELIRLDGGERVWLTHEPNLVWNQSFRNSWQLYGHVHSKGMDRSWVESILTGKALNVNVELHNYQPWSEEEIRQYMLARPDNHDYTLWQASKSFDDVLNDAYAKH